MGKTLGGASAKVGDIAPMSLTRHVRIVAVFAPEVNRGEVGLSLGTDRGDRIHLVSTRLLAREFALSILRGLGPEPEAPAQPRRSGGHGLAPEVQAYVETFFAAWQRGEITLRDVAEATGVGASTAHRLFRRLERAELVKAPVLKPGGSLL